jgi:hypothetical protein
MKRVTLGQLIVILSHCNKEKTLYLQGVTGNSSLTRHTGCHTGKILYLQGVTTHSSLGINPLSLRERAPLQVERSSRAGGVQ